MMNPMIKIKDLELHQLQNLNNVLHAELCEFYEHLNFIKLRASVMIALANLLENYQKALQERLMERDPKTREKLHRKVNKCKQINLTLPFPQAKLLRHVLSKLSADEQHNFELLIPFSVLNSDVSDYQDAVARYNITVGQLSEMQT